MKTFGFAFLLLLSASVGSAGPAARLRNTYYYVVRESDYERAPRASRVLDLNDRVLAEVSAPFKRALDLEGTGRLLDGRVLNFAGRKNGEIRYLLTSAPFGLGVGTCRLQPFHTVAVDPAAIPLGAVVRIEETVGMTLPDGSRHDGLWRAEDIGSAIVGDRIDLFLGDGDQGQVLERAGIANLQPLTVTVVAPPRPNSCVDQPQS